MNVTFVLGGPAVCIVNGKSGCLNNVYDMTVVQALRKRCTGLCRLSLPHLLCVSGWGLSIKDDVNQFIQLLGLPSSVINYAQFHWECLLDHADYFLMQKYDLLFEYVK